MEIMWANTEARGSTLEGEIDAREAELIGKPLRVVPAKREELDDDTLKYVNDTSIAFGGSGSDPVKVPDLYLMMLRHPGLFRTQLAMTMQLVLRGVLPERDRELAILRVLWLCGSPSPYGEHVLMAKMKGVSIEEVRRIKEGSSASGWSAHEKALLSAAEQLVDKQVIADETWAVLAKSWTEPQLMEFGVVVGQYIASAVYHNTMRTRLAAYNRGLRQE
jgi:alkylhydroperoxidase family enzyme